MTGGGIRYLDTLSRSHRTRSKALQCTYGIQSVDSIYGHPASLGQSCRNSQEVHHHFALKPENIKLWATKHAHIIFLDVGKVLPRSASSHGA